MSFEYINNKIKQIHFSTGFKKTVIPALKKSDKLLGTASQNIYLINILPFALYDIFNNSEHCEYWECFLILRTICNIVMAFNVSIDQISVLRELIFDYFALRKSLFPDQTLKPKHHYLLHYPYLIKHFGPLRHVWTLRFESKHGYFKKCVKHTSNFKNVLFSLSNKHQLLQCLNFHQNLLFNESAVAENASIFISDHFSKEIVSLILQKCSFGEPRYICGSVYFRGIQYTKNMFYVLKKIKRKMLLLS